MTGIVQDIRYALRGLRKSPSFTLLAVLTLALGIGANTAMFSVLNAVVLRPLPFRSPEQLVMLWTEMPNQALHEGRSAYRDVEQWRAQSQSFVDMAVFDPVRVQLTAPGELEQITVVRISPSFFSILGVRPIRGRIFSTEEANQRHRVVVLSHQFWRTRLAAAENIVGTTIALDGVPSEVIGILPADFQFRDGDGDVWEPYTMFPDWEARRGAVGASSWFVMGRLRPDVTIQQAEQELNSIQRTVSDQTRGVSVMPLSLHVVGHASRFALWMLMGAVVCVLLIAVTNITNLTLARSASREREMAIRSALGATRLHIIQQLLIESLALAILSGLLGLQVAAMGMPLIKSLQPRNLPSLDSVGLDARVLSWTLGLSVLAGMLIGLVPAVTIGRRSLRPALDDGNKGSSTTTSSRATRRALVVAEFALAIVLLVGAGLLIRSLMRVQEVDPGFRPERVVSIQLSLPAFNTASQRTNYYRQVLENVEAVRGVENASVVGDLFIGGTNEQTVTLEGTASAGSQRLPLRRDEVSDDFFVTLRVPLLRGRLFSFEDGPDTPRVAIISDTMARRLWPGQDSLGKRFKLGPAGSSAPWFTVVGIAGDMRRQGLEHEPVAQMFEPLAQNPSRLATLLVRTATDPLALVPTLKAAIGQTDRRAVLYGVTTLTSRLAGFQADRRFQTSLLVAFSLVALALAAIGIYGLMQFSIATRTREMGVRMAVGAQRRDIIAMILAEGLKLSLAGMALGLLGALWLGHIGSSLLFGVGAADPITYAIVLLLLTTVAAAGCYFPARRATRVDPLVALRYE